MHGSIAQKYKVPQGTVQARTTQNAPTLPPNPISNSTERAQQFPTPTVQKDKESIQKQETQTLSPEMMPRPNFLSEQSYNIINYTSSKGNFPPSTYFDFRVKEDGNANPRVMRSNFNTLPVDPSILNNTGMTLSLILQPFADIGPYDEAVPLIDEPKGPFRCGRCRTYINPNFVYVNKGTSVMCNICKMENKLTNDLCVQLDQYGNRIDRESRFELCYGVYEFWATPEYHLRKNIVVPNFLLCIEMSYFTISQGIFNQALSSLQSCIENIPCSASSGFGIMTFDSYINYYKVPDDLTKDMQIIQIADYEDISLPLPLHEICFNIQKDKAKIDYLISKLQDIAQEVLEKKAPSLPPAGAVLNNAINLFAETGGKVVLISCQPPYKGFGKIVKRVIEKDEKGTILQPQHAHMTNLANYALQNRVTVDLFLFPTDYYDYATFTELPNITGGSFYSYYQYNYEMHAEKFHYDLYRNLTRYTGSDVILRARSSNGLSVQDYITPGGKKSTLDVEFSSLHSDYSMLVTLKQEEKLTNKEAYVQIAVLYTNPYGDRVIRIINYSFNVADDILKVYQGTDNESMIGSFLKKHISLIKSQSPKTIEENLLKEISSLYAYYRISCAANTPRGELILPDVLKIFPCYTHSSLRLPVFKSTLINPDTRLLWAYKIAAYPLNIILSILYPRIYALHDIMEIQTNTPGSNIDDRVILPKTIGCYINRLEVNGIFLIDNGEIFIIYVRRAASLELIYQIFGVSSIEELLGMYTLPYIEESDLNMRIYCIIEQLRKNKGGPTSPILIAMEGDSKRACLLERVFVEDEHGAECSYHSFLKKLHKLIQNKQM